MKHILSFRTAMTFGYRFDAGTGLALANLIGDGERYTLGLNFSLDTINPSAVAPREGYVKLVDFKNKTDASGLYLAGEDGGQEDGTLILYVDPLIHGPQEDDGINDAGAVLVGTSGGGVNQVFLTRKDNIVSVYVGDDLVLSFDDDSSIFTFDQPNNPVTLFQEDGLYDVDDNPSGFCLSALLTDRPYNDAEVAVVQLFD